MLLSHAQRLCVEFGIAVVVTSHASIDPMHAWDRRPYGGVTSGHEAKFSFELTKATSKRNEDAEAVNPEERQDDGGQGVLGAEAPCDGRLLAVRVRQHRRRGVPLMGWKLKGAAVLLALVFLAATLWPLTL